MIKFFTGFVLSTLFIFINFIRSDVMRNKLEFYRKYNDMIITEKTYTIEIDKDGLYLSSMGLLTKDKPAMYIPTSFLFTSCNFYPLKDEISIALKELLKYSPEEHKKHLFEMYHLIFYLLYHKVGSKQSATSFYHNVKNFTYTSNFFNYDRTPDELNFFNQQIIKNLFYSVFYLPEEDLELAKEFGYNFQEFKHAIYVFNELIAYTKQSNELVKDYFSTFFTEDNLKVFKYIAGYVFRYYFPIKKDELKYLYNNESLYNEYTSYQKLIDNKVSFNNEDCIAVMPFIEVLKHHQPLNSSDFVNFTAKIDNHRVLFYFNKDFSYRETLAFTYGGSPLSNEKLLLNYGMIINKNIYNTDTLEVILKKKNYNEDKASVCSMMKCTNVDFFSLFNAAGQKNMNFYYPLQYNKLSLNLLSLFKLKSIPNQRFNPQRLFPYFISYSRLDFQTELLAVCNYYSSLRKKDDEYVQEKLMEDLITLRIIKEKYPRHQIILQGKIYLLQTQIEKKQILVSQYQQLFKYQMKNFKKEFEKLKVNYL